MILVVASVEKVAALVITAAASMVVVAHSEAIAKTGMLSILTSVSPNLGSVVTFNECFVFIILFNTRLVNFFQYCISRTMKL